jgi:hypothetical protein
MENVSRRHFLVVLSTVTAASGAVLAGCGKKEFSCKDVPGLDSDAAKLRETVKYTDHSPEPAKKCSNCLQYKPAPEGCGGCNVVKGTIHPDGYCTLWAAKPS